MGRKYEATKAEGNDGMRQLLVTGQLPIHVHGFSSMHDPTVTI